MAAPLQAFIRSRKPFATFTPEMEKSIQDIKAALISKPVLAHPDFSKDFQVHSDASPYAIGATLVQHVDGEERVIMYASRALKGYEQRYHQHEREALALTWSCAVFRPFLLGRKFKAVVDNSALTHFLAKKQSSRIIRWVLALQEYDIEYVHRPATQHGNADGLSRATSVPANFSYTGRDEVEALLLEHLHCLKDEKFISVPQPIAFTQEEIAAFDSLASQMKEAEELPSDLPSREELVSAQRKDPALLKERRYFEAASPRAQQSLLHDDPLVEPTLGFFVRDDVLFRRARAKAPPDTRPRYVVQICIPRALRRAILYSVHGLPISGHEGVARTYKRLFRHYYWENMPKDCKTWVAACLYCQRRKPPQPMRHGLTGSLLARRPFELVSFDILGRFPRTAKGNEYLLTAVDAFTRYPLAIPIPDRSLKTVVEALFRHLVAVFGPPRHLLSDKEKSFTSKVTKALFAKMGVSKIETTGHQPQANASVERFHRYLNASLTFLTNPSKTDWDNCVDACLYAYRTSECAATGQTPFKLLFGRTAHMPPDLLYNVDRDLLKEEETRDVHVSESMKTIYKAARRQQLKLHLANARRRDGKRKAVVFQANDSVLLWDETADTVGPGKLQYRYSGPHRIVRKDSNSDNLYHVQRLNGRVTKENVNRLRLANLDCSDLGPPLAPPSTATDVPVQNEQGPDSPAAETPLPVAVTSFPLPLPFDMVALRVASDPSEPCPFAIGQVLSVSDTIEVQWFGTQSGRVTGAWRPGFYFANQKRDSRRYYARRKSHFTHLPYTSTVSETSLTAVHLLAPPFQLADSKIPRAILQIISNDPSIDFSLPS